MNHFSNMYSNLAQQECVFTSVKSVAGISVEYNSPASVFKDEFVEWIEVNDGCGNEINFTQERELYLIYER